MKEIILPSFKPRPYQREWLRAFFIEKYNNMILICHRRSGKDLFCINLISMAVMERVGTYLYLLPEQAHAKRIIWDGIDGNGKRFIDYFPKSIIKRINNTEMIIEFKNGSIFRLGASDQYDRHVGTNPVLIVFGEYSLQKPNAWNYLSPILVENKGKAIFQFTPRSYNHAYDLYMMGLKNPAWYVSKLDITQTCQLDGSPVITRNDIDEKIKEGFDESLINQEYYCSFEGPNTGSYYGKVLTELAEKDRIIDFDIKSDLPVYTAWDLGVNHPTVIWMWQYYNGIQHFIYCYDNIDEGLEHYYMFLKKFAQKYNIRYAKHIAPHDIQVKEFGGGRTRYETALHLGIHFKMAPRLSVADGIYAVRKILHTCSFHRTNCQKGLKALQAYCRQWNDERKCYIDHPNQDWSTDFADAFRYFAVTWTEQMGNRISSTPVKY